MKAQVARTVISLAGLFGALVIFMTAGAGWLPIAACIAVVVASGVVAEAVFRRRADAETRRRDLEDRVHNIQWATHGGGEATTGGEGET